MSSEQYSHERLEWDATHSDRQQIVVAAVSLLLVFLAFALIA